MARQHKCQLGDIFATPTYAAYHRAKTNELVLINTDPRKLTCHFYIPLILTVNPLLEEPYIKAILTQELGALAERRAMRKNGADAQRIREIVADCWRRMSKSKIQSGPNIIPGLRAFRQIPTIHSLEKFQGIPEQLETELKNRDSVTSKLVNDCWDHWVKEARRELAIKLDGKPPRKHYDDGTLHPTDRLTARYNCKRCGKVSKSNKMNGSLVSLSVSILTNHILTKYRRPPESACMSVHRQPHGRDGRILGKSMTLALMSR
jgi:hypothetical protein